MDTLSKIITLLAQQNKTQKDLTDYLGLQNSTFTKWNLGKNTSYRKHISKIAEYLNVSTDYLLGTEQKNSPDKISELDKICNQLSKENILKVEEFARFLASQQHNQ